MGRAGKSDRCDIFCVDQEKVSSLRQQVQTAAGLANFFKLLADETRLKIAYALSREELCVCDVAAIVGISVAAASHHLRLLKNCGLARQRRQGKMVFYTLQDQCVRLIIETALNHQQDRQHI